MHTYNLLDMLNSLSYENASRICLNREEERDRLGIRISSNNLWSVTHVMDFQSGRIDDFHASCLIVADRLFEYGIGLAYYLQTNTQAKAFSVIENYSSDNDFKQDYDFIIFCGYQKDKFNYQLIEDLRNQANPPHIIMLAHRDTLISEICSRYNIIYSYDRYNCLSGFINYLLTIQHNPKIKVTTVNEERNNYHEEKTNNLLYRYGIGRVFFNIMQNARRNRDTNL